MMVRCLETPSWLLGRRDDPVNRRRLVPLLLSLSPFPGIPVPFTSLRPSIGIVALHAVDQSATNHASLHVARRLTTFYEEAVAPAFRRTDIGS